MQKRDLEEEKEFVLKSKVDDLIAEYSIRLKQEGELTERERVLIRCRDDH